MRVIDKNFVKKQFDGGLKTYHQEAIVQKKTAEILLSKFSSLHLPSSIRLLEIGCGTGFLTRLVVDKINFEEMWCNDISTFSEQKIKELTRHCNSPVHFVQGDAEEISYPSQLDAVISGSTVQWFKDQPLFFEKACNSLKPGGVLAFSTFGKQNFKEISFLTGVGLVYHSLEQLRSMLSEQFEVICAQEWCEVMTFQNPLQVLRHIKQTGVNGIKKTKFGKDALARFTGDYIDFFSVDTGLVCLTYHPMVLVAVKR